MATFGQVGTSHQFSAYIDTRISTFPTVVCPTESLTSLTRDTHGAKELTVTVRHSENKEVTKTYRLSKKSQSKFVNDWMLEESTGQHKSSQSASRNVLGRLKKNHTPSEVLALAAKLNGELVPAFLDSICEDNQENIDRYIKEGVNLNSTALANNEFSIVSGDTFDRDNCLLHQKVNFRKGRYYEPQFLTALHYAAIENKPVSIKKLVEHKAVIEAKSKTGDTPFLSAVTLGNKCAINELVELKCDVKASDNKGQGAIELAAQRGDLEFVKYCVEDLPWEGGVDSKDLYSTFSSLKDCSQKKQKDIAIYLVEQSISIKSTYLKAFISRSVEIDPTRALTVSIIKCAIDNDQKELLMEVAKNIASYTRFDQSAVLYNKTFAGTTNNIDMMKVLLRGYFKSHALSSIAGGSEIKPQLEKVLPAAQEKEFEPEGDFVHIPASKDSPTQDSPTQDLPPKYEETLTPKTV